MNGYDPILGDLDLEALCASDLIDAATQRTELERDAEAECTTCGGFREVQRSEGTGFGYHRVPCPTCHGTGVR